MFIELTKPQTVFYNLQAKFPLFVAGFGSGKSTMMNCMLVSDLTDHGSNANVAAYAPTYDLLKLITIPYLEEFLTLSDIPYKLNKSDYILSVEDYGNIILRSMDNPARIVGYQVFRSHIDELDTLREEQAKTAWNKIIARNRQKIFGRDKKRLLNRVSAYTTPEGYLFCYKRWVKEKRKGYVRVHAPTMSNAKNLPDDYIDSLLETYDPQLAHAYLEGKFVNLTSGAVYPNFSREKNNSQQIVQGLEPLYVGMDFNVLKGASVIHVERGDNIHAVDEIHDAYDTDQQISILKTRYPNNPINVYPDATGSHRTASNTTETDLHKLRKVGFRVHANFSNPLIKERVASFNALICNGKGERKYFVNVAKCPRLTDSLEQQVYDKNGQPDKKAGLDHIVDAPGYYIHFKFPIIKPNSRTSVIRGGY